MNLRWHFLTSVVFFIGLMLTFKVVTISLILYPIFFGCVSDFDRAFNSHRNIIFHSIIIPLFVLVFNFSLFFVLCIMGFGLHCICDISILSKKGGFFTIKYFGNKAIDGFYFAQSWLICNFIVSIVLFTVYMVCFV